jgi:endonuclease YncB( thermonuclease family)
MRRRNFLKGVGVAGTSLTVATTAGSAAVDSGRPTTGRLAQEAEAVTSLYFDSTTGLLNADGEALTDDSMVPVYAMDTARAVDQDGNGDATKYGDSPIAMVAANTDLGGGVFGFGCPFVTDDADFSYGNDEFLLNVWASAMGEGTVLWDEGHSQYYGLSQFGDFESYAEDEGFTVETTTDIEADLEGNAGVVITSPSGAFSEAEKTALSTFVEAGGSVFLHSQSDYDNFDETDNLNDLAASLGAGFRFNDAQIVDEENNAGPSYVLTTSNLTTSEFSDYFEARRGIGAGPKFEVGQEYEATVESVDDGDTVTVSVGEGTEEIRILGVDSPEKDVAAEAETPYEWPGLGGEPADSYPTLSSWGQEATAFAEQELAGETVTLSFDENEGISDPFGRLLCLIHYDAEGNGGHDTLYDQRLVETGHARAFHSDLTGHDDFLRAELDARENDRGLWADSTPADSSSFRNEAVSELFVPRPVTVGGQFDDADVLVRAAESADPAGAPLVVADAENRVAVAGGLLANDAYEQPAGFEADTSGYGNYPFLTNVLTALADKEGDVLITGGNGQFSASGSITAEAASYYQRHLEGEGIDFNGVNDLANAGDLLADARAVLVTAPTESFSDADLEALSSFRDDGGAVVLLGSGAAETGALVNLNSVAGTLGSDVTLGLSSVTDTEANVAGRESIVATSNFDDSASVFAAFDGEASLGGSSPTATEATTETDGSGDGSDGDDTDAGTTATEGPGFGALSGVAGIVGGAAYAVRNRLADE